MKKTEPGSSYIGAAIRALRWKQQKSLFIPGTDARSGPRDNRSEFINLLKALSRTNTRQSHNKLAKTSLRDASSVQLSMETALSTVSSIGCIFYANRVAFAHDWRCTLWLPSTDHIWAEASTFREFFALFTVPFKVTWYLGVTSANR